jgi:addiction module HigA family antidote
MSKSRTITDEVGSPDEWLHNPHAGEMLSLEFMEPAGLDVATLAAALEVAPGRLEALVRGDARIDADLDLRLTRYFGMTAGFFLGLQDDYELLEARRSIGDALSRIVPRAA